MKKRVTVNLNVETIQKVKEWAEADNRDFSNMMETILKEWLKQNKVEDVPIKRWDLLIHNHE